MNSDREFLRQAYREACGELDDAVEHGDNGQAQYWLGRKRAIQDVMEEFEVGIVEQ